MFSRRRCASTSRRGDPVSRILVLTQIHLLFSRRSLTMTSVLREAAWDNQPSAAGNDLDLSDD